MKGLIVSLIVFAAYVVLTAVLSHITKPKHPGRLFFPTVFLWCPAYFVLYALTPSDLGFLPDTWLARIAGVDVTYGFVVYLLNCHSYIDFFFACNGGFSMSLMLEMLQTGDRGVTTEQLTRRYYTADGVDKIYGWRIPHLEQTGCALIDKGAGTCRLTPFGRFAARLAIALKRFLNLGLGG